MPTLQELCSARVAKNIDVNELIDGLISGDANTLEFLEDVCQPAKSRQSFANSLLPNFFVVYKIFAGHENEFSKNEVSSVKWSRNSKYIACGLSDGIARIWDVETGENKDSLGLQDFVITGDSFIPWYAIAGGSSGYTVNVVTGEGEFLLEHLRGPYTAAWSPDGKYLASGSLDKTVRIWRKIADFNQILLILILQYLKKNNRMHEFYEVINLPHLNKDGEIIQLVLAWFDFNPIEQRYLKQEFGIDG
jgi:hypothetical protein